MVEQARAGLAVVARPLGGREAHELLLACQRGDELRGRGADVVALGIADPGRAGDVLGASRERVLAQGLDEVERLADAVHEQSTAERPAGRRLAEHVPQQLLRRAPRHGIAVLQAGGERPGEARPGARVEIERAAVGDAGREPVLGAGSARREMGAQAEADERHPAGVDVVAGERVVQHGRDDVLPVGPQLETALEQGRALTGTVEGEHVVAARERGCAVVEVQLLGGAVVAAGEDDGCARGRVVARPEEVAGQRRVLERDLEDLRRPRHQPSRAAERSRLPGVARHLPLVGRRTHEHGAGRAVVGACAQVCEARGLALPRLFRSLAERGDPIGQLEPGGEPAAEVALVDPGGGGQAFADVGAAVGSDPPARRSWASRSSSLRARRVPTTSSNLPTRDHGICGICRTPRAAGCATIAAMTTRVLVLGAGFGGLELFTTSLSEALGDGLAISRSSTSRDSFVFGFSKLDVLFGREVANAVRVP